MPEQQTPRKVKLAAVVHVIDPYRLVLNQGSRDGVKGGDRYVIYEMGPEITDPSTKESLGRVEIVKGRGKVTHVQDRMATLSSAETRPTITSGGFVSLSQMTKYEELPFESPKVGDLAKPS